MQKILVYPFEAKDVALVRQLQTYDQEIKLNTVCTYPGSGLSGKDLGYADARNEILGIAIEGNLDNCLKENDVLIVPPTSNEKLFPIISSGIEKALHMGKDVVNMSDQSEEEGALYHDMAHKANVRYRHVNLAEKNEKLFNGRPQGKMMFSLPIPVIFIGGITSTGVDEVVFTLANLFRKIGITATCLGESNIYNFLNFYSYGSIIQSQMTEEKKAKQLNLMAKYAYEYSHADIMIVQLPGTISKYNECITGDFGIYTYMFSQIFSPDYFIFTSIYGLYDNGSYNGISSYVEKKFGFGIDGVHLSNEIIDSEASLRAEAMKYTKINMEKVDEFISKESSPKAIPIYNLFNAKDWDRLFSNIKLSFNIK